MKEAEIRIHIKNLRKLTLKAFKTLKHLKLSYLCDRFNEIQVEYNMRNKNYGDITSNKDTEIWDKLSYA